MIINELKKQANREMYWVLTDISEYASFEEYTKYTNYTREDFKEELENGFIQDITPINWNVKTVMAVLLEEVNSNSYDYVSDSNKDINRIWDFVSHFDTFILEGKMYFNAD